MLWPTALPYVMTGFRLAASVALILTITGELVIGTPGLGKRDRRRPAERRGPRRVRADRGHRHLGVLANLLTRSAERRVLAWHPSIRGEEVTVA